MEESSSDEEREMDMETLDPQSLVKDEKDQEYIDSLPEFQREAILAERFEKLKNEEDMKKALRESKRKEREQKKLESKAPKGRGAPKATAKSKAEDAQTSSRELTRNKDVSGKKQNVAAALASIRVSG